MVKSKEEVIAQFNKDVNMTVEKLEEWLEDPKSTKAGTGVGIESGHKILEILRKNPTKDPAKYDDEDLEHMRKVVGYTNRHLAQENKLKETKTREELENAKSTISLKNWGHDPVKAMDEESDDAEDDGKDKSEVKSGNKPGSEAGATKVDEEETETAQPTPSNNGLEKPDKESTEFPEDNKDEAMSTEHGESKDGKKRKLSDAEPIATTPEADVDEPEAGADITDEVNEDGESDSEERPRKKSKVDGTDDTSTA